MEGTHTEVWSHSTGYVRGLDVVLLSTGNEFGAKRAVLFRGVKHFFLVAVKNEGNVLRLAVKRRSAA